MRHSLSNKYDFCPVIDLRTQQPAWMKLVTSTQLSIPAFLDELQAASLYLARHQHTRLAITLPEAGLASPEFTDQLLMTLSQLKVKPSNLMLLIHECLLTDCARLNLAQLNASGIDLCVDDYQARPIFGIKALEFQEIKYLQVPAVVTRSLTTCNTVYSFALGLKQVIDIIGKNIIFEGVNSPDTLEVLLSLGASLAQGTHLPTDTFIQKSQLVN